MFIWDVHPTGDQFREVCLEVKSQAGAVAGAVADAVAGATIGVYILRNMAIGNVTI